MTPKMLELQSCCWYVSLRTGTKILGFISLVGGLLLVTLTAAELSSVLSIRDEDYKWLVGEICLELVLQIIHLVTSFLLLLGAYQENRKLILPWLASTVMLVVSELLLIPSSMLSRVIIEFKNPFTETSVFLLIIDLLDEIYGFLVVYSYYRTLPPMDANPV